MKNRSPRLLVLASTFPARPDDGTPAFVRDLALQEGRSFDVRVLTPRVPGAGASEKADGIDVRRFSFFPRRWEDLADGAIIENLRARPSRWLQVLPFMLAEAWAVRRHVREFRPDAIHAHWIIPQGLVATLVAPRVPRVITTLGGDLYALNAGPLRWAKSLVLRRAAHVTVMNEEMAQLVRGLGAVSEKVSVMPMGVDLEVFQEAVLRRVRPTQGVRLLFVGRLVEKKGLGILLDAIRAARDLSVRLTVVGDGPLRSTLEEAARGLDVSFVGQLGRTELAKVYAEHDVILVPSVLAGSGDKDGLPVALLEAMASGCAVVASDLPGINEAVVNERDGILVASGDVDALTAAVRRVCSDPALLEKLATAAAERAEEYSITRVGGAYVRELEAVLPGFGDAAPA